MKSKSININELHLTIYTEKYKSYTFQFESEEMIGFPSSDINEAWSNFLHAHKDMLIETINIIEE